MAALAGYRSEFAFAAAFKRHHGTSPGRWRTASRQDRADLLHHGRAEGQGQRPV